MAMTIESLTLVPCDFNGGREAALVWKNEAKHCQLVAVAEFFKFLDQCCGPWPEEVFYMANLMEAVKQMFDVASESCAPGTYVGEYVEMGGDGNFSIEMVLVE